MDSRNDRTEEERQEDLAKEAVDIDLGQRAEQVKGSQGSRLKQGEGHRHMEKLGKGPWKASGKRSRME